MAHTIPLMWCFVMSCQAVCHIMCHVWVCVYVFCQGPLHPFPMFSSSCTLSFSATIASPRSHTFSHPLSQILVDGVNFLSSIEATQMRAARNGCGGKGEKAGATVNDGRMQCTDFCAKAGAAPAKLCGMMGVQHDTGG